MIRAISGRLTLSFAFSAAFAFLLGGVLLYASLRISLERQVHEELELRAALIESSIDKTTDAAHWKQWTQPKLESIASAVEGTWLWVEGSDPAFRFGKPPGGMALESDLTEGFSAIPVIGYACDLVVFVKKIPANGERPGLRLLVAKDPTSFMQTLQHFRYALMSMLGLAVALVAVLAFGVSRYGLQPVAQLSRQAQLLDPHEPSARLGFSSLPRELEDLTVSFNGALDRLERARGQLEAFNADVAHELRTPLMNLIGQTQVVLARPRTADDLTDTLSSNLEEFERMRGIVNDMLFLARADQGALAQNVCEARLSEEVNKVVEFYEPLLDEGSITVAVEGCDTVLVDRSLFRRAMSNLLHNAVQHTPAGGSIRIRIHSATESPRITVTNPGPRILETHLNHLFDRFYRADVARTNSGESHGLGLSIVKAIAHMHQGEVFAQSDGVSNTFGFSLSRSMATAAL